jgi:hypothetical protein
VQTPAMSANQRELLFRGCFLWRYLRFELRLGADSRALYSMQLLLQHSR